MLKNLIKRNVLAASMSLLALLVLGQQNVNSDEQHFDLGKLQELDWNQTIAKTRLPRQEKAELIAAIKSQLQGEPAEDADDASLQHLDQTEIKFVDLHEKSSRTLVAQATGQYLCSPTGNCSLWILSREGRKYRVILEGTAQTFAIQPTVTNGWHDVVLGMHGSAFETQLTLYKFDGKEYSAKACYMAVFPDKGENELNKDEARITTCR